MQKLYTVKMLCEVLNRHDNTIRRWIDEGLFPHATRIRGGIFVPAADLQRLIRSGRVAVSDPLPPHLRSA